MRTYMRSKLGFTIVELSIYGAILGIFLVVLTTLFTSTLDLQLESEATTDVVADSRYIFSRFSYDIGRATAITIPASLGLETNSMQLTIDGTVYTYSVNNGRLELVSGAGTDPLNSAGSLVSDLSFLRLGNVGGKHSLRINLTITSTTKLPGGPEIREYQTTIALR